VQCVLCELQIIEIYPELTVCYETIVHVSLTLEMFVTYLLLIKVSLNLLTLSFTCCEEKSSSLNLVAFFVQLQGMVFFNKCCYGILLR